MQAEIPTEMDLLNPRIRWIFSDQLNKSDQLYPTKRRISLECGSSGLSAYVDGRCVFHVPAKQIKAAFRKDRYTWLDGRFRAAADAVVWACG